KLRSHQEHIYVRGEDGKMVLVNPSGEILVQTTRESSNEHLTCDPTGRFYFCTVDNRDLTCEDILKKQIIWRHQAPEQIRGFSCEQSGGKLAYLAGGEVVLLSLLPPAASPAAKASQSVQFLEL